MEKSEYSRKRTTTPTPLDTSDTGRDIITLSNTSEKQLS